MPPATPPFLPRPLSNDSPSLLALLAGSLFASMDPSLDAPRAPPSAPLVMKNQLQTMEQELHSLREAQVKQLEAKIRDLEAQLMEYSRRYSKLKVRHAAASDLFRHRCLTLLLIFFDTACFLSFSTPLSYPQRACRSTLSTTSISITTLRARPLPPSTKTLGSLRLFHRHLSPPPHPPLLSLCMQHVFVDGT